VRAVKKIGCRCTCKEPGSGNAKRYQLGTVHHPGLKCGRRPTAVIPQSMEVGTDIPVKVHEAEMIGQVWGRTAHQQDKDGE
jgi:hypothetical protein